jgi:hypothetical protein
MKQEERNKLLDTLRERFEKNRNRHEGIEWKDVLGKLESNDEKLKVLQKMEISGGEPDMVAYDREKDEYVFFDCSPKSPAGRRSLCYDNEAWESRKANKPTGSALGMAKEMGIEILTVEEYHKLQSLGDFDTKTSSWVKTPERIRKLGGALFCDKRYDTVFVYHNGAESYYASRGFRGYLRV